MKTKMTSSLTSNVMTDLFPTIGISASSSNVPMWMPSMKIFKVSEYTSAAGHRYLKGLRFSNNLAVAFSFSFWNTWTYLNEIEVYRFNGNSIELADRRKCDKQFYEEDFLKNEVKEMVRGIVESSLRMNGQDSNVMALESQIEELVEGTYRPLKEYDRNRLEMCIKKALPTEEPVRTFKLHF